jgi:hypothetical protein
LYSLSRSAASSAAAVTVLPGEAAPTYAGAIQIAVGNKAMILDDEAQVDAMEGDEALMMLNALEALQARVALVREKVAEKAAAKGGAGAGAAMAGGV